MDGDYGEPIGECTVFLILCFGCPPSLFKYYATGSQQKRRTEFIHKPMFCGDFMAVSENTCNYHYTALTALRGDELLCFCNKDTDSVRHIGVCLRTETHRRESLTWISVPSLIWKLKNVGIIMRCAENKISYAE